MLPARASFLFPDILKLLIKLRGFGSAALGALCVPNPAEYVLYRRFVTVAVAGGASREKCFQKNAFIKEHCLAKKEKCLAGKTKIQNNKPNLSSAFFLCLCCKICPLIWVNKNLLPFLDSFVCPLYPNKHCCAPGIFWGGGKIRTFGC